VLDRLDAVVESVLAVVGEDGHRLLGQDGPVVHGEGGHVDGAAGDLDPGGQGVGHGVGAAEGGQQAGVGVDHPAGESVEDLGGEHGHEPGHGHQVDVVGGERLDDGGGERQPVGQVPGPVDHHRGDAGGGGPVEGGHSRPVGDDHRHRQTGVDDRLQVGAASRGQHSQLHARPHSSLPSAPILLRPSS
jgi:hypothetical protein